MKEGERSVMESWRYGNPEDIADRLIGASEAQAKRDEKKAEQHRRHKARRIRALVKQAMMGERK